MAGGLYIFQCSINPWILSSTCHYRKHIKTFVAAMQLESSELAKENELEANDDGTVDEEFECTEEEIRAAEEQVAPYFDKIMETYTGNADALHKDLVFTAMETIKQSRKQCEVCTETHPADRECWYRGAEFQPDWLRKRVEQVNMRD
jgi:hypothetical protein